MLDGLYGQSERTLREEVGLRGAYRCGGVLGDGKSRR
jgi:hypothetical protein